MKKILLVIFVLALFGCNTHKIKKNGLEVQVKVLNQLDISNYRGAEGVLYSVKIDLINNTDSVVRFWTMLCSWEDNWLFNFDSIWLYYPGCDKNFPVVKQIEPCQKLTYNSIIEILSDINNLKGKYIKLGFILIKEKEMSDDIDFRPLLHKKRKEKKDIIWSEPFKITK